MWLDSDQLVAAAWSDAQSGKAVSVPGWQYQLLVGVISSTPRRFVRKIGMNLRKRQR
jgi:short-subunit dehydrogenase